ncbi:uncharacterized protein ACO6RY_01496 [Pungitius sinensis]
MWLFDSPAPNELDILVNFSIPRGQQVWSLPWLVSFCPEVMQEGVRGTHGDVPSEQPSYNHKWKSKIVTVHVSKEGTY